VWLPYQKRKKPLLGTKDATLNCKGGRGKEKRKHVINIFSSTSVYERGKRKRGGGNLVRHLRINIDNL